MVSDGSESQETKETLDSLFMVVFLYYVSIVCVYVCVYMYIHIHKVYTNLSFYSLVQ